MTPRIRRISTNYGSHFGVIVDVAIDEGFVERAEIVFDEIVEDQIENTDEEGRKSPAEEEERNILPVRMLVVHH